MISIIHGDIIPVVRRVRKTGQSVLNGDIVLIRTSNTK